MSFLLSRNFQVSDTACPLGCGDNPCRHRCSSRVLLCALAALFLVTVGATKASAEAPDSAWHVQVEARLSAALARYESIAEAGGWQQVPAGPTLKPGVANARVEALRRRLEATADVLPTTSDPLVFDSALEAAVRAFQARHGLLVDGLVGPETLAALNVPVTARVATLRLNSARLSAFKPLGQSYLLVNIPGYEASMVRGATPVLKMRIVVGRPSWPTPQLNGVISRIVINPYWTVPYRILTKELIPRLRRDPHQIAKQNMRVFSGWGPNARELDPAKIDWHSPAARGYRLRQEPGNGNALGRLKFVFDNPYSVYLHDTPAKHLFDRPARAFSHGCIRIEKPFELALLLLKGQSGWDAASLEAAIAAGRNRQALLEQPLPIYLVYWTAWVDEDGRVQFRPDLYRRDLAAVQNQENTLPEGLAATQACDAAA